MADGEDETDAAEGTTDGSLVSSLGESSTGVTSGSRQKDTGATFVNGVFYGGAAYLFGYLWVYVQLLRLDRGLEATLADQFTGDGSTLSAEQGTEAAELLVPPLWQYAGWIYHYAKGGSIGVSLNLLPGSYAVDNQVLYPFVTNNSTQLRSTVLTSPWELTNPSVARQFVVEHPTGVQELSLITVTPTALFFAGLFLAYRHGESTPVDGAIAGAKATTGFLLLSVVGVFIFTVTISGFSLSGEAGGEVGLEALVDGSIEGSLGAEVSPTIEIGPSLGRALLTGFVYPMVFATLGGSVGGLAGRAGLLDRLSELVS